MKFILQEFFALWFQISVVSLTTSHQLLLQLFLIIGSTILNFGIFTADLSSVTLKTYIYQFKNKYNKIRI